MAQRVEARRTEPRRGRSLLRRFVRLSIALFMGCLIPVLLPGCGSRAWQYARDARSSYISARAVLAEVKKFPSSMEELLRSRDPESLPSEAEILFEEARGLISAAAAAFRTVQEKVDLLRSEGDEKFTTYADALEALVKLNQEVIGAYGEFIGLSGSVLEGLPYTRNPSNLMPTLERMDRIIMRIQDLTTEMEAGEKKAESLYRELSE